MISIGKNINDDELQNAIQTILTQIHYDAIESLKKLDECDIVAARLHLLRIEDLSNI